MLAARVQWLPEDMEGMEKLPVQSELESRVDPDSKTGVPQVVIYCGPSGIEQLGRENSMTSKTCTGSWACVGQLPQNKPSEYLDFRPPTLCSSHQFFPIV